MVELGDDVFEWDVFDFDIFDIFVLEEVFDGFFEDGWGVFDFDGFSCDLVFVFVADEFFVAIGGHKIWKRAVVEDFSFVDYDTSVAESFYILCVV